MLLICFQIIQCADALRDYQFVMVCLRFLFVVIFVCVVTPYQLLSDLKFL